MIERADTETVSLILTTYNCRNYLIRTLDSIREQDYPDMEVVIKDGGSTDGTLEIIKEYAAMGSLNIVWNSGKDRGIYDAMNQGLELSSGGIIAFFNDQFLDPSAVSKLVSAMQKECAGRRFDGAHADLIYTADRKVVRFWKMGEGKISQGWMPGHPTLYLRREIYERYGGYRTDYSCSADYEFMVRILKDGNIRLAYVPEVLVSMFYGGTSSKDAGSYLISLKEGHRALKENQVKPAVWIDLRRTARVMLQFIRARRIRTKR